MGLLAGDHGRRHGGGAAEDPGGCFRLAGGDAGSRRQPPVSWPRSHGPWSGTTPANGVIEATASGSPGAERPAGGHALSGVVEVFRYANTWLLFFIPASLVGSVLTFCGLWGVPYLTTHCGLSTTEAAALTSLLMMAWAVACPVFGWLSDRMGRRKPLMIAGHALAGVGWAFILFAPGLPVWLLTLLTAATGICSASFIICWSLAKESVPARRAGTISGRHQHGRHAGRHRAPAGRGLGARPPLGGGRASRGSGCTAWPPIRPASG